MNTHQKAHKLTVTSAVHFLAVVSAALLLAVLALVLAGCYEQTKNVNSPTDPPPICAPPASVAAVVSPRTCTATASGIVCVADYSLGAAEGDVVSWQFVGGAPPDSEAVSGAVTWTFTGLPRTVDWTATRCTCSAADDPDRESCRTQPGKTTFVSEG